MFVMASRLILGLFPLIAVGFRFFFFQENHNNWGFILPVLSNISHTLPIKSVTSEIGLFAWSGFLSCGVSRV
jgi:hypothetical protein